jgi:transglutaminase-like putative cysteine protease
VIYEITHLTHYSYGAIVEFTTGVLRLAPRSGDGQEVERFSIVTDPVSQPLSERLDPFGNRILSLRIEKHHRQLSIAASSRVRVNRSPTPTRSPKLGECCRRGDRTQVA